MWPLTDDTLTIRPHRARIIFGLARRIVWNAPGQVGPEHDVPLLVAHPRDEAVGGDPGVVHEDLDRPELLLDLRERGVDGVARRTTSTPTAWASPPASSTAPQVSSPPAASEE